MKDVGAVKAGAEESIAAGIQILAPGTPLKNFLTMVEVAKRH